MSIKKKLYYGFGGVLLVLTLLFLVMTGGIWRQQSAQGALKNALEAKSATGDVKYASSSRRQMIRIALMRRPYPVASGCGTLHRARRAR